MLYDSLPASATAAEADKPNPNDIYAVVPAKVAPSKTTSTASTSEANAGAAAEAPAVPSKRMSQHDVQAVLEKHAPSDGGDDDDDDDDEEDIAGFGSDSE